MTQMHVRHLVEKETATGEMWRNDLVLRCEKPELPMSQNGMDRPFSPPRTAQKVESSFWDSGSLMTVLGRDSIPSTVHIISAASSIPLATMPG